MSARHGFGSADSGTVSGLTSRPWFAAGHRIPGTLIGLPFSNAVR
jgi:hypothetical protein